MRTRMTFTLTMAIGLGMAHGLVAAEKALPKVVDFGDKFCVPCKLMAPALEQLQTEQTGKLDVQFVGVSDKTNRSTVETHKITTIPTQIFFDSSGKEVWRHEGYISKHGILLKWRELGIDLNPFGPSTKRLEVTAKDDRPKDQVCFLCDGDVAPQSKITVPTEKGNVNLCSAHHFFVMLSCLQKEVEATEAAATITHASTGEAIPVVTAQFLYGVDADTGRPTIHAFADVDAADKARASSGGNLLPYHLLKQKELSARCGFCDRSVYPEDSALVKIEGVHSWGCCAHCSMGSAARLGKDIEIHQPDGLTGEPVIIKTMGGYVASIEPPTAVAWFGKRKNAEGKFASAGCFHQGFFVNEENLRLWLEKHPLETGEAITIEQSLQDKMALSPAQIQKACKIGECSPK